MPLLIPRQKGETELAIRETTIAGRRYVICRNEEEAKKDAAARAELVAGLERKLARATRRWSPTRSYGDRLLAGFDTLSRQITHRGGKRCSPVSTMH